MTLIKIVPESIKPNPRAGQDFSWFQGPRSATFEFPNGGRIPGELWDKVIVTEWRGMGLSEDAEVLAGHIIDPDDWELFIKISGITLHVDNGRQKIHHHPEPYYLYEYEDPELTCSACGTPVKASDIEADSYWDGEDDIFIPEICPHCKAHETFGDIEYQTIAQALQELKH